MVLSYKGVSIMKNPETAKRLQEAIRVNNMIPQELADRTGISKASISQYLSGQHKPSNISAGKMAEVLGVSPLWLMGFEVPMYDVNQDQNSGQVGEYYLNNDARELAEFLHKNPEYKVLFDASRKVRKEDIEFVRQFIERMS